MDKVNQPVTAGSASQATQTRLALIEAHLIRRPTTGRSCFKSEDYFYVHFARTSKTYVPPNLPQFFSFPNVHMGMKQNVHATCPPRDLGSDTTGEAHVAGTTAGVS